MPPDVLKCLHDLLQAAELVVRFTAGKDIEDFRHDVLLRSAVERQFITIGESLQQALNRMPELDSSISECRRIINFRNVMVHGYARIVADTVWGVVEKDIPVLIEQTRQLMPPRHD